MTLCRREGILRLLTRLDIGHDRKARVTFERALLWYADTDLT